MEVAIVRQFLTFFQEFLDLCQTDAWPDHNTTYNEIQNALITSQHIEKCMEKLHRKNIVNEFLTTLNEKGNSCNTYIQSCLTNPPKYILNKIIVSDVKTHLIESSFSLFIEIFSQEKLEDCLADVMVEVASKQTLLKHLPCLPKQDILILKSKFLLSEMEQDCKGSDLFEVLLTTDQKTIEVYTSCLLIQDPLLCNSLSVLKSTFNSVMLSKSKECQSFWKCLVNLEECLFVKVFLEHNDLFRLFAKSLIDNSRLLRENMSGEYFYIDLTYSELVHVVCKICGNQFLKCDFFEIIKENQSDVSFWNNMLASSD